MVADCFFKLCSYIPPWFCYDRGYTLFSSNIVNALPESVVTDRDVTYNLFLERAIPYRLWWGHEDLWSFFAGDKFNRGQLGYSRWSIAKTTNFIWWKPHKLLKVSTEGTRIQLQRLTNCWISVGFLSAIPHPAFQNKEDSKLFFYEQLTHRFATGLFWSLAYNRSSTQDPDSLLLL